VTEADEKAITNNLKKLTAKYDEEDDKIINAKVYEEKKIRDEKKANFLAFLEAKETEWQESKKVRVELLGFDEDYADDMEYEEILEEEIILDSKEIKHEK